MSGLVSLISDVICTKYNTTCIKYIKVQVPLVLDTFQVKYHVPGTPKVVSIVPGMYIPGSLICARYIPGKVPLVLIHHWYILHVQGTELF